MNHPALGQLYQIRYFNPDLGHECIWSAGRIGLHGFHTEHELQAFIDRLHFRHPTAKVRIFWLNAMQWQEVHLHSAHKYSLFSED